MPQRWAHVQSVSKKASDVGLPALLVDAGLLHDIGYSPALATSGFHPLDGARFLKAVGCDERLVNLVANHTCAEVEAELRGLGDQLRSEFPKDLSLPHDELCFCDMTTGPAGSECGSMSHRPSTVRLMRIDVRSDTPVQVPVVCTKCGLTFGSGITMGTGVHEIRVVGNRLPCPKCGSTAITPDSIWSVRGEASEALARLRPEARSVLRDVLLEYESPSEAADALGDDPELAEVSDRLRSMGDSPAGRVLRFFLLVLLTVALEESAKWLFDHLRHSESKPDVVVSQDGPRPGRNEPCWCGSGQKYKRCHLRATN